jgi:hypothetical protein
LDTLADIHTRLDEHEEWLSELGSDLTVSVDIA